MPQKATKAGRRYNKCERPAGFLQTQRPSKSKMFKPKLGKKKVWRVTKEKKTYDFSQRGGKHVSDRCHVWCGESSAGAQQGLDAVVGDKESSSCNQAEPQPFKAH